MLQLGKSNSTNALLCLHGYTQSASDLRLKLSAIFTFDFLKKTDMMLYFPVDEWYNYTDHSSHNYERQTLISTRKKVHKILDILHEQHNKVLLLGYSQGASVALDSLQTYTKYIPTMSISGLLLSPTVAFPGENYHMSRSFYYIHGDKDSIISVNTAKQSYGSLSSDFFIFDGNHWDFWHLNEIQTFTRNFVTKYIFQNKQSN